ncbi:transposase [Alteromonas sp. C1M14]|uniref:transposase n=1 Tax=Alteromonas sp. C1M14 TaxID=2841567 RepID=UPI001C09D041|nr:transposase [Alteromonas sp. C1M14]MBU2978342.1 transposase [Alteromonas sp. C1M14]
MARKLRTSPAGIPQLIQRQGRDNLAPFKDDADRQTYLKFLENYASRYKVALHAWSVGKSCFLALCTPSQSDGISLMLQATGRLYAQYYHQRYNTTGTIWRDRYKSALVLDDEVLLAVYRFIEQSPVNEGLCDTPEQHPWSSVTYNGLGQANRMITPHKAYIRLGTTTVQRCQSYRGFVLQNHGGLSEHIGKSLKMGLALGDAGFIKRLEQVTGRRLTEGKRGRPPKHHG